MSAGHCKISDAISRTMVAMEGLKYTELKQQYKIDTWVVHPDFVQSLYIDFDYSVITLADAVTMKPGVVETISLPAAGQEFTGTATISGWGKIAGDNDVLPITLQITDIGLMDKETCGEVWGERRITKRSQCVGGTGTGSCNGDSGGPLFQVVDGVRYLIGNTSWGASTCNPNIFPTVYSKNSVVIPWILSQL